MKKSRRKHVSYSEGQWVAVPLDLGGYALGIVARGNDKTKGGLGYFFGPVVQSVPKDEDTWDKKSSECVLVAWFGFLGLLQGAWPLIPSTRPFHKDEWPVPKFKRMDLLEPNKGWLIEYPQEVNGLPGQPICETYLAADELVGLPDDGVFGYKAIELVLARFLPRE